WTQVRPGHELQRGFAIHWIDRNPEADVLAAFDVVVRLILMPGCRLPGGGLLGEHVIVIEPSRAAAHQPARGLGEGRFENKTPIVRILLPIAEVLDEAAGIIRAAGHFDARTRMGEVLVDAGTQHRHFVRPEQPADADRAVSPKAVDAIGVNHVSNASIVFSLGKSLLMKVAAGVPVGLSTVVERGAKARNADNDASDAEQ